MENRVPMTKEGYQLLQEELKRLKTVERPNVIQAIAEARAHGDLSENAEYSAAKEKQSFIEGRINEIGDKLARAHVIDTTGFSSEKVVFGATVSLIDLDNGEEVQYRIVGVDEADLKAGKISITSPVARALIGHSIGDAVKVKVPSGFKEYEVLDVYFE
jgi:transcription elongation factor GreA